MIKDEDIVWTSNIKVRAVVITTGIEVAFYTEHIGCVEF